ncbi:hypothetical protein SAMN05421640_0354 [Ekhidna lutea]|uniref:Right handed beta helix region n=1 Tax=Ekhidna lutea TaxID=447679 RepID=A0A239EVZ4_EKHLU|nr:hypothetical protein [Ekhidna lutea]SNS48789.1 hypothetical protein SAMN05421640_0354 [Ekhidna lutea]
MKRLISLSFLLVAFFAGFSQNIWIADNRPTAPTGAHIFADVTSAIAAASPGDIIHVIPSQFTYPNFTVTKDSLTFFGIGYNPNKEQPSVVFVTNVTIDVGVFGTRLSGINIATLFIGTSATGSLGNIFIENGEIDEIEGSNCCGQTTVSSIIIRNCILGQNLQGSNHVINLRDTYVSSTSVVITNNIIMGSNTTSSGGYGSISVTDAIIKNNLFLGNGSTTDFAFNDMQTSTISNNIFLGRQPITDATGGDVGNSTFNNNITFGAVNDTIPTGNGNTSNGDLINTDPLLVNVPIVDDWDFTYDPSPDTGSPAIGAGNDGNDIGVSGGTIPYSSTGSPLPVIQVLRLPEIIQEGTDTNATIEAEGN